MVCGPSHVNATLVRSRYRPIHPFRSNSSGKFVTYGDTPPTIDLVLLNPEAEEGVAGDTYESATELAGRRSTETSLVGVPAGYSSGLLEVVVPSENRRVSTLLLSLSPLGIPSRSH